jgi:phenylacetate-CoA ligase
MHYGAERLGMTVIPVSGGNTARQVMLIQDFGPHVMACTPSYALTLADALLEEGINPADINLFSFVLGAEPWTEEMRTELEDKLQAGAVNIYGLSEIIGPGVSCESIETKNGAHIFEDHFMVEVINPETGEQVAEGEVGELVFTTLTKEALPLLRYRTGDLATVTTEPSPDGRTQARMSQIVGRVDDMLIIRGVNVFPTQIEAALVNIENITPHHRIVITREGRMDEMEVQVEVTDEYFRQIGEDVFRHHPQESAEAANRLENEIAETLKESLGLTTKVTLLAPGEGIRSQGGKLKRVVDEREL